MAVLPRSNNEQIQVDRHGKETKVPSAILSNGVLISSYEIPT